MKVCKQCGGTRLPNAQVGIERGTCSCLRPGRVRARLATYVGEAPVYVVEFPKGTSVCERPTLWRAMLKLEQLRKAGYRGG